MPLSLRQIRYFVATAERGQVTQAAIDLGISQSAITTSIQDLERQIGTDFFVRSTQGMELSAAGRQFLFHCYEILNKVEEAMALNAPASDVEGGLTIAATYTVVGYFLPNHLDKMHRNFPKLTIRVVELGRDAIEEGLLCNRYDIAVLLTSNVISPDLMIETLLSSRRRLWVASKHHLLQLESVGLKEAAAEPYIMLTVDEAAQTSLSYWKKTPYQPTVALRTTSVEAVRSMVANGQGVAILSDMVLRPWSLEGRKIGTIILRDAIPAMDVGLAWRRGARFTAPMEAVRSYFRHAFHIPATH